MKLGVDRPPSLQYKPQKCLLVGDTCQLPSTVFSKEAEKMYARLFASTQERSGMQSHVPSDCKQLRTIKSSFVHAQGLWP